MTRLNARETHQPFIRGTGTALVRPRDLAGVSGLPWYCAKIKSRLKISA